MLAIGASIILSYNYKKDGRATCLLKAVSGLQYICKMGIQVCGGYTHYQFDRI